MPENNDSTFHLWVDDDFKVTACGLLAEIVVETRVANTHLCEDCLWPKPAPATPAESAFLEVFFPNAS